MPANFHLFAKAVASRLAELESQELFTVEAVDLFETYLAAFPDGTNPTFRKRTEHDCSCCKNFIRNFGRVVAIRDGEVETVWDKSSHLPYPYDEVAMRMEEVVRQLPISGVFRTKERQYGQEFNFDHETNVRWDHFCGRVTNKHLSAVPEAARGEKAAEHQVFQRGLEELTQEAVSTVLDLIDSNSLYRGAEFRQGVSDFQSLQAKYALSQNKPLFVWEHLGHRATRLRNTAIGTLLVDLSEGVDLDHAVRSFEQKVAPLNYKRPTALITPRMIEDALVKLDELGLESAVHRRYVKLSDVSVNEVIFVDNAVQSQMKGGLRGLLLESATRKTVSVEEATPISWDTFLRGPMLGATSVSVLLQNKHLGNFVSLTGPEVVEPGKLFRWDNDFAWSYDGDATDSIKQRVKRAGGNVEAKLRVSLAWFNTDDLDIHVRLSNGRHIFYGDKGNILDVDMNVRGETRTPVENLAWNYLPDGTYEIWVNNFQKRETTDVGFVIEVEYGGRLQQFSYAQAVPNHGNIGVLNLTVLRGELTEMKVSKLLVGGDSPTEKWGVTTGSLVPVDTMMFSPNHWDGQGVGARHTFFFLRDCRNPGETRGIYNEFLRPELDKHRKVFEVLGAKTKCPPSTEQLSGLGFTAGRGDEVTVLVKGQSGTRAYNVQF